MSRAVFLDRDGVINQKAPEGQYVTRWEDMHFLPGTAQAIAVLNRAEFRVIVVSNQRCVAKGLVTEQDLETIHQRMCDACCVLLPTRGAASLQLPQAQAGPPVACIAPA